MATQNPRRQTFADLVKEPTWSETAASRSGRHAPRPGGVNPSGEFFDPHGLMLLLVDEDASVEEAQRMVDAGALIVVEGCGCGGGPGGCTPQWLSADQVQGLRSGPAPRFTGRYSAPTWIEVWGNDERNVVFAHGDVSWGAALD